MMLVIALIVVSVSVVVAQRGRRYIRLLPLARRFVTLLFVFNFVSIVNLDNVELSRDFVLRIVVTCNVSSLSIYKTSAAFFTTIRQCTLVV